MQLYWFEQIRIFSVDLWWNENGRPKHNGFLKVKQTRGGYSHLFCECSDYLSEIKINDDDDFLFISGSRIDIDVWFVATRNGKIKNEIKRRTKTKDEDWKKLSIFVGREK